MDRKEAKIRLQILLTNRCSACRYGVEKCTQDCEVEQAVNMAIEALSAETHEIRTETHGVCLISKDDAMGAVQDHFNDDGFKGYDDGQKMMDRIKALPSAKVPTKCIAEIKIDADEVAQKIKEKYDLADRPNIAYICGGTACDGECDECHHTTDIEHAKNFKNVGGKYIETDDRQSWEWIPCSERMPEDGQGVIICTDDNRFKDHPVGTCTYEDGRFHTNYRYNISMVAWMPLPKPYKGSDSE